jgi:probable phosphoglycerate mutase
VAQVRERFPREYQKRGRDLGHFHPPGGESFSDLQNRVVPAFQQIVARMQGPVLIVGHAGVNRVILCHVLGMPLGFLFRLEQPYGALSVLICEDGTEIRVEALNLKYDRSQGGML